MTFAKRVFTLAGIYGVLVIAPMYFLEPIFNRMGQPLSHPESYYGFVGITLTFQLIFLLIGRHPARYRPLMLISIIEKVVFPAAVYPLWLQGRTPGAVAVFATIDLTLAVLFFLSWRATRPQPD